MKSRSAPEQSLLMGKRSSKPADHNAMRVRNNQRRHRARVKSRIEDLEKRLEDTNAKLEAALSTAKGLAAELEVLRSRHQPQSPQYRPTRLCGGPSIPEPARPALQVDVRSTDPHHLSSRLPGQSTEELGSLAAAPTPTVQRPGVGASASDDVDDGTGCNCEGLPPPAPGESTLTCSSAFQIIEQQSFSGVEVATIRAWLGPGFRKAPTPGEACRVETLRLYELLDHITSSS